MNNKIIDSIVHDLQDAFNERAAVCMQTRAEFEKQFQDTDWLLVNIRYNPEKFAESKDKLGIDSFSGYLTQRNQRNQRWKELAFSQMEGGPFQSIAKDDKGETVAIRSIFFVQNNGIGGDIRNMDIVGSVELLDSGLPVHDMVMERKKAAPVASQKPKP